MPQSKIPLKFVYNKDPIVRSLISAMYSAYKAHALATDALRGRLREVTVADEDGISQMIGELLNSGTGIIDKYTPEETLRRVKDDLLPVLLTASGKTTFARVGNKSNKAVGLRKRRVIPVFSNQGVSSAIGAVLVGPPDLVKRAIAAVRLGLSYHPKFKVAVLSTEARKETLGKAKDDEGAVREVTFFSPWWDSAHTNKAHFSKMLDTVEETTGGPIDVLVFEDLGKAPKSAAALHRVSDKFVVRGLDIYQTGAAAARARGGAVVAGLALSGPYEHRDMLKINDAAKRFDLSQEDDGLLYATDGYGHRHLIPEVRDVSVEV